MNSTKLPIRLAPDLDSRIVTVRGTTRRTVLCQSARDASSLAGELRAFGLTVKATGDTLEVA